MSQMIEMHSADHCVVVAELATSFKGLKFSKQRPDICKFRGFTKFGIKVA